MKKINSKGFTLVELLAVIVIMGILMMVAIPAVTRTIENSRKDTFIDIAKSYANAATTLWTADGLSCGAENTVSSAVDAGDYYIKIDTENAASAPVLLDKGGKSSWGNRDVKGYVRVNISNVPGKDTNSDGIPDTEPRRVTKFYVALTDGTHGVADTGKESSNLKRGDILMTMNTAEAAAIDTVLADTTKKWCVES